MGSDIDETLVADVARVIVARVAPAELPVFRVVSKAYFADPARALGGVGSSGPLGLGATDAVMLLSPVTLAVATEVTRYLLSQIVIPAAVRGGAAATRAVRRIFGVGSGAREPVIAAESAMELTDAQWTHVRQIVVEVVGRCALSEDVAQLIGDAVVGIGHNRDGAGES